MFLFISPYKHIYEHRPISDDREEKLDELPWYKVLLTALVLLVIIGGILFHIYKWFWFTYVESVASWWF